MISSWHYALVLDGNASFLHGTGGAKVEASAAEANQISHLVIWQLSPDLKFAGGCKSKSIQHEARVTARYGSTMVGNDCPTMNKAKVCAWCLPAVGERRSRSIKVVRESR